MQKPRRLVTLLLASIALAVPATVAEGPAFAAPGAVAAHSCGSGYTHAKTPGGHKCLRAGQYCSHKPGYGKAYKNAGYRCKRNGHLERR